MEKLSSFIKKKPKKKGQNKVKYQFQDIALELADELEINGNEKGILFKFIKNKIKKGQWWKIKEVREYMKLKEIKSLHYFMACFKKKKDEPTKSGRSGKGHN